MILIVIVTVTVIGAAHLIEDLHKGTPLPQAFGLFALTWVLVSAIVILGAKYLLTKWQVVLKTDGNIDVLGVGEKKIRVYQGDSIAIEHSPDGRKWLLKNRETGTLLHKLPYEAFPKLQETWNKMWR